MKILKVTKQPGLHILLRRYIFRKTNFEPVMKNVNNLNSNLCFEFQLDLKFILRYKFYIEMKIQFFKKL